MSNLDSMKLLVEKLDDSLQFNDGLEFDTDIEGRDDVYHVSLRARRDPFSAVDPETNPLRTIASVDFEVWAFGTGDDREIEFLANLILHYFRERIAAEVTRQAVAQDFAKKLNEKLADTDMSAQTSGVDGCQVDVIRNTDTDGPVTIVKIVFRKEQIEMIVLLGDVYRSSSQRRVLAIIASLAPGQLYSII